MYYPCIRRILNWLTTEKVGENMEKVVFGMALTRFLSAGIEFSAAVLMIYFGQDLPAQHAPGRLRRRPYLLRLKKSLEPDFLLYNRQHINRPWRCVAEVDHR